MKKILILANSSGGLYDFRNELVEKLLKEYRVSVSLPDEVRTRELADEGCKVIHTPINRRGVNPAEDFRLLLNYRKLLKEEKQKLHELAKYLYEKETITGEEFMKILQKAD